MVTKQISGGVVHELPADLWKVLVKDDTVLLKWESLTPLARNEWICWSIDVKQQKTRDAHVERVVSELEKGMRRPCCWIGCSHRTDKAASLAAQRVLNK